MRKQRGYILALSLMLLSVGVVTVTQLFYQGGLYDLFVPTMADREQAKQLALAGLHIAMEQLALRDAKILPPIDDEEDQRKKEHPDPYKEFLKLWLTVGNRLQKFTLTKEIDGLDGEIGVCLLSEHGKIPIVAWYDVKKEQFVEHEKKEININKLISDLCERGKAETGNINIYQPLLAALKKSNIFLRYDASTLLIENKLQKAFQNYFFYVPQQSNRQEESKSISQNHPYYLDLFTVFSGSGFIDPWLLSPSLRGLIGIIPIERQRVPVLKEIDELLKDVDLKKTDWKIVWPKVLAPLYEKQFNALPKEFLSILSTKFEPRVFSVLCYGKVGQLQHGLCALIERQQTKKGIAVIVKKIYWI